MTVFLFEYNGASPMLTMKINHSFFCNFLIDHSKVPENNLVTHPCQQSHLPFFLLYILLFLVLNSHRPLHSAVKKNLVTLWCQQSHLPFFYTFYYFWCSKVIGHSIVPEKNLVTLWCQQSHLPFFIHFIIFGAQKSSATP